MKNAQDCPISLEQRRFELDETGVGFRLLSNFFLNSKNKQPCSFFFNFRNTKGDM